MITNSDHPHAVALEGIRQVLDDHPNITERVWQDPNGDVTRADTGAEGMRAVQVLQAASIKPVQFDRTDIASNAP